MPTRNEKTLWFRPDGRKVDAEISFYEWQDEETLTILKKEDDLIPVEMHFRHTTRRVTCPISQAVQNTKDWVNAAWMAKRSILQTRCSLGPNDSLCIEAIEEENSSEEFDDVPMVYVWMRLSESRMRQYRAQRTVDVLRQTAFDLGREQKGVLRWCTKVLSFNDPLPAEASLTLYDQRAGRIEIHSRSDSWSIKVEEAVEWLNNMRQSIREDRTWVLRNGRVWDGKTIKQGDFYWVEGWFSDAIAKAIRILKGHSLVWWKNNSVIAGQIELSRARTQLKELRGAYRRGELEIRRNGFLWRDEPILANSRWDIRRIDEFDPGRLEEEGVLLPTPPPLLGMKYYTWNFAPRAVPIGQDPLRWLNLSPDIWQVA
jgi:hypothetical protein